MHGKVKVKHVAIVGRRGSFIERCLSEYGFTLTRENPDVVISYGGDGTALYSEQLYPGFPKVMIRDGKRDQTPRHLSEVLNALKNGDFDIEPETKVEGRVKGTRRRLVGLNEVNVCHRDPTRAIRFNLQVDDALLAENVIGDGVIVATPYGSTAYFASIARRSFGEGLGIAFNNPRNDRDALIVDENSVIAVELLRGPGWLCADNNRTKHRLFDGDVVVVRRAKIDARIVSVKGLGRKIGFCPALRGNLEPTAE